MLKVEKISVAYDGKDIIKELSFSIKAGEIVGVIGPNGAGKSTLVRAISRILQPQKGCIKYYDQDVYKTPAKLIAKSISVVPQATALDFDYRVYNLVLMGRIPHLGLFEPEKCSDLEIVEQAMKMTGVWELRNRFFNELSGGERQQVIVAKALAAQPSFLVLDEPTSHLDIKHQIEILDLVKSLNRQDQLTALIVLHDINLAAAYCQRLLVLKDGQLFFDGLPKDFITLENLDNVYGVQVKEILNSAGQPWIVYR
ncbi:MAG: ABC transporter ATP-binding protein [Candidatus Margulisiibacteriota bacterium]|jgi:iron complex transport system ATP-binding protein